MLLLLFQPFFFFFLIRMREASQHEGKRIVSCVLTSVRNTGPSLTVVVLVLGAGSQRGTSGEPFLGLFLCPAFHTPQEPKSRQCTSCFCNVNGKIRQKQLIWIPRWYKSRVDLTVSRWPLIRGGLKVRISVQL